MDVLDKIEKNFKQFSYYSDRDKKKLNGQFFTPKEIAKYMSSFINVNKSEVRILDPGAGNGILSCAVLYKLLESPIIHTVYVDLYEIDKEIISLLDDGLLDMKRVYDKHSKKLVYNIKQKDFIGSNEEKWNDLDYNGEYDIVISNPPYKKIRKNDDESNLMKSIVYGQPNMYFLFMAMAIKLLKKDGQFIFITPRSYFCGTYFIKFRIWLLSNISVNEISILDSRKNVFGKENVLQETVIISGVKNENQSEYVNISKIDRLDFNDRYLLKVEKDIVFENKDNFYIKAPTNKNEYYSLKFVEKWDNSLEDLNLKVSTGKVVPFRCKRHLLNENKISKHKFPLIWNVNLKNGVFAWPVDYDKRHQVIDKESETVENSNYLFIKRISSKEESRRIQIIRYYKEILKTDKIGIENHVNYIYKLKGELDKLEMLGLYVIFNSNIIDNYFRVLCGSTQVNATEINSMKFPNKDKIKNIGRIAEKFRVLSSEECDTILINYFG